MRLRIQSYKPSKSAKTLSEYLDVPRLRTISSSFRGKPSDIIINWGNVRKVHNSKYLNPLQAVRDASNKISTFSAFKANEVPTLNVYADKSALSSDTLYFARTTVTGHSGQGIVVGTPSELPDAPLYTQFIDKVAEYRIIVVNNTVVDRKRKLRKRDFDGDRSPYIWNCDNGYIFARNDISFPNTINDLAISAMQAINLNYGAVDIIEDRSGNLYAIEINTAFGLCGSSIQLVGDAIKGLINEICDRN